MKRATPTRKIVPQKDWCWLDPTLTLDEIHQWTVALISAGQTLCRFRYGRGPARNGWARPHVLSWLDGYWINGRRPVDRPTVLRVGREVGGRFHGEMPAVTVPTPSRMVPPTADASVKGMAEAIDRMLFSLTGPEVDERGFLRSRFTAAAAVQELARLLPDHPISRLRNAVQVRPRMLERIKGSGFDDRHRAPRWLLAPLHRPDGLTRRIDELLATTRLSAEEVAETVAQEFDRYPARVLVLVRRRPEGRFRPSPPVEGRADGSSGPDDAIGTKTLLKLRNLDFLRRQGIDVADLMSQIPADLLQRWDRERILLPDGEA